MDKNMIHIDDLIRQRLNGEEEERAGAWLRMKDLLDKDMPNKQVIGFGWRKTLLLSAAVVAAIATVGIAGYEMSSKFRDTDNSVTAVANPSFATNKATENAGKQTAIPVQDNEATGNVSTVNANTANTVAANADKDALNPTTTNSVPVDVRVKTADKTKNTNKTTTKANASNKAVANNTSSQPQPTISSANTTSTINKPELPDQKRTVADDRNENTTTQNTVASAPVKMETVPVLNINEKIIVDQRTGTAKTETVEVSRTEMQREVPVAVTTPAPVTTPQPAPKEMVVASAKAPYGPPRDEFHSAVENSMFASAGSGAKKNSSNNSSSKSGVSMWQHVSDYFNRAQYQLGETKINTGVIGGLNKTFGNYGLLGMNVGMFSDFMFSETWGARLEAKYMHWFNQGTTYRNDYTSYTQEGNLYNKFSNDHSFKYSTMWNVDVPVMLQYRPYKSNIAIFAGANLSYFSKLTPEETNRQTLVASGLSQAGPIAAPMTVADFNSRFGMGAILGVGYNLSDMMQVGLRVSQSFTDNAKGANAQQVSKDLYRTPNVQLNFSYRFGKDKKED